MATERFTSVQFHRFKAFNEYSIALSRFNILVGPNNSGKSTILGAFRILAEGMRKARTRNPILVRGPDGDTWGYWVELENIPVATENVFFDYDESKPATARFRISNGNELLLFFPEQGSFSLICRTKGRPVRSTSQFITQYDVSIGFVPILGPVEHDEPLYQKDAARSALLTHRAARNFRNIWYHYPDDFEEFLGVIGVRELFLILRPRTHQPRQGQPRHLLAQRRKSRRNRQSPRSRCPRTGNRRRPRSRPRTIPRNRREFRRRRC